MEPHAPKGQKTLFDVGCTKRKHSETDGQPRELRIRTSEAVLEGEAGLEEVAAMDEFEDPTATATVRGMGMGREVGRGRGLGTRENASKQWKGRGGAEPMDVSSESVSHV